MTRRRTTLLALLVAWAAVVPAAAADDIVTPPPFDPATTPFGFGPADVSTMLDTPYTLNDLDMLTGTLVPDTARGVLTDQHMVTLDLSQTGQMAIDALAAAERARREAEARRAAMLRPGQLGPDVPFADIFNAAGATHNLDPRMLAAVARVESEFVPEVIDCRRPSSAGALGLMQLMPFVAQSYGVDPCNPVEAVDGGARMLRGLWQRYGSFDLAFAAYNVGPGTIDRAGKVVTAGARPYVDKVNRYWAEYRSRYPDGLGEGQNVKTSQGPICLQKAARITVACHIAPQVSALVADAAAAGMKLTGGGYRSYDEQVRMFTSRYTTSPVSNSTRTWNGVKYYLKPGNAPAASPGRSLHERGEAIDFNCDGSLIVSKTNRCFIWLSANAYRYGLKNYPVEAWHWSTTGG